ncbi:Fic family protein [Trueperella pyogenes]|uniref:Fic/DOC family protein n=1 Tax=Trueperella pyogenes TaxID=1661 RepID=UPI00345DC0A7
MSDKFEDPYIDTEYGVLRNLVGARTYSELRNAEGELVSARLNEYLATADLDFSGSLSDFKSIHRFIFQDIYAWAGEIRTVEIAKAYEGAQFFLPSANITMGFAWAQKELVTDDYLRGLEISEFATRLAYHFDNYNFIHPFREGNGRVQRLFWSAIGHRAGFDLDWRLVSGDENDEASRLAADDGDLEPLIKIFLRISSACDPNEPINSGLVSFGHLEGA